MAVVRTALVTGASGFIGRVLCERLCGQGVDVYAVMRRSAEGPWRRAITMDIGTEDLPAEVIADADTIFHLAARVHKASETSEDDTEYRRVNVNGTRRVLDAAIRVRAERFVFFGSVKAMGEGGAECTDETWEAAPQTAYGRSKLEAERIVAEAGCCHGLHTANLRLPLVYGPGGRGNLERMLGAISRGRFPPLPEVGNKRSMVHVTDVVEAALLAARRPEAKGQTYIVTDGPPYSTREIYALMCEALGKEIPAWAVPAPVLGVIAAAGDGIGRVRGRPFPFDSDVLKKLTGSAWYSSEKIERGLGFKPSVRLKQALPEMVAALDRYSGARVPPEEPRAARR